MKKIPGFLAVLTLIFGASLAAKADGRWTENAPMETGRAHLGAAGIGEYIYVAGGAGISGPSTSFDAYDVVGDFWRPLPSMPVGREQFGMTAAGAFVYVSGGLAGSDRSARLSRDLWVYDTGRRAWVEKAPMPLARRGHALQSVGEKVYALGGGGEDPGKVMVYNIAQDSWAVTGDALGVPRSAFAAVSVGRDIYVFGGLDLNGNPSARVDKFNTETGRWSRLSDMPIARSGLKAAYLDGRLHVAGGTTLSPSHTYIEHHSFDLQSNKWLEEPRLLTPRHSMASAVAGGRWYLIGGGSGSGFFTLFTVADSVEAFKPTK
ncbi:MAG: hypothetical protein EP347_03460 [Alphaproteobacteria bacterium]|nr:MAG: hypothetical protein EP347_03460 [Alphaproteobacteria bacterium]